MSKHPVMDFGRRMNNGDAFDASAKPLHVLVVGAGIGGLSAAIGLRQQGHTVDIYERSRLAQETGAAIHLGSNCNGLLRRMGLWAEDIDSVECLGITNYVPETGATQFAVDLTMPSKMWAHPWHLSHRAHLHTMLKDFALGDDGPGTPVRLHTSSHIASVDAATATITMEDGSTVAGDVIVGADGVHSRCRASIPGGDLKPFDSGKSAFRFLVPTAQIKENPETAHYVARLDVMCMWHAENRRVIMYPCMAGTMMNFVCIYPSVETGHGSDAGGWQAKGSKADLLKVFDSFSHDVKTVLSMADEETLKVWTLLDLPKMPSFAEQKLAVIGDAAHPFLPYQGQGGGQAIEDATSVAAVLPLGTTPDQVADRLELYNRCRYDRAQAVLQATRYLGMDLSEAEAVKDKPDQQASTIMIFAHDEWDHSTNALRQHLEKQNPSTRHRAPYGFGPAPGPRQPLGRSLTDPALEALRHRTPETSTVLSIKLRTSSTYLKSLLPPGFAFSSPSTHALASISIITLDGLTWLGGRGYSLLSFAIHGTNYTKRDGSKVFGQFAALMLESLADPIVTGRDELGMPKLFADIDTGSLDASGDQTVSVSWRGFELAQLRWQGLSEQAAAAATNGGGPPGGFPGGPAAGGDPLGGALGGGPPGPGAGRGPPPGMGPPPPDAGELVHRYVPAVGEPGKADADYAVFLPFPEPSPESPPEVLVARSASVRFDPGSWESLPTLHGVVQKLADMPMYGVVEAKMTKISGAPVDMSRARRIE